MLTTTDAGALIPRRPNSGESDVTTIKIIRDCYINRMVRFSGEILDLPPAEAAELIGANKAIRHQEPISVNPDTIARIAEKMAAAHPGKSRQIAQAKSIESELQIGAS